MKKRKPIKKKNRSRKKKWRHVYPYDCRGCGKRRIAFMHERAKAGLCTRCEPRLPDPNQQRLFDEGASPTPPDTLAGLHRGSVRGIPQVDIASPKTEPEHGRRRSAQRGGDRRSDTRRNPRRGKRGTTG